MTIDWALQSQRLHGLKSGELTLKRSLHPVRCKSHVLKNEKKIATILLKMMLIKYYDG